MTVKECRHRSKVFGGLNFMTPVILGYFECGDYYIELSAGPDTNDYLGIDAIFGATVAKDGVHDRRLSKPFGSKSDAYAYMQELSGA